MRSPSPSPRPAEVAATAPAVEVELIAVVVAAIGDEPCVLTISGGRLLPSGPFETGHRSLQTGLRAWVERQTRHPLGYVEQLYTFADRGRSAEGAERRAISISYLGLSRHPGVADDGAGGHAGGQDTGWRSWHRFFPWEDRRGGPPPLIAEAIAPRLRAWAAEAGDAAVRRERLRRARVNFGLAGLPWNEEFALQRYEMLFEAGLVPEAARRRGAAAPRRRPCRAKPCCTTIAASWRPRSPGCAPRSSTAPWCSSWCRRASRWAVCSAWSRRWPGGLRTRRISAA